MAESQTGKQPLHPKGYTLIEVLFTVAILAGSMAVLMPSFFKSTDVLNHLSGRLGASLLFNDLAWEAEEYLKDSPDFGGFKLESDREEAGRRYHYKLQFKAQDKNKNIYEMAAVLEWQDFKKSSVERATYVFRQQ